MRSTVASRSPMMRFSRSCVIGRAILMPSSSVAMAVASSRPIQMGRLSLLSGSFRMTIGVLVTGSSVRPPTVIWMKFSRLMPRSSDNVALLPKGVRNVNPQRTARTSTDDHAIDHAVQLVQVPALLDDVAIRQIAIHLAVAEAPGHAVLRVQPDELFRALADLLERPLVRQVVVVPSVAEHDHRRVTGDRGQMIAV